MTGYSLKEISARLNTGQIPQVTAGKPIYTQEELIGTIGNINSPLLDMPLKNSLAMKSGVGSATFTRASTATYIDRYGVLRTAAIDEPRFEKEGYLNEGSSTNLLTYSEQFDNAIWIKEYATVSANTTEVTDPYGTNLADKLIDTVDTSQHLIWYGYSTSAISTFTYSVFVKKGNMSEVAIFNVFLGDTSVGVVFNFDTKSLRDMSEYGINAPSSSAYKELANGWFRVSISYTPILPITSVHSRIALYSGSYSYTGTGNNYTYIFGAQLEALPFASSYIPTVASTVTRSADNMSINFFGNSPNGTHKKTIMIDFLPKSLDGMMEQRIFDFQSILHNMIRLIVGQIQSFYGGEALTSFVPSLLSNTRWAYVVKNDVNDLSVNTIENYANGILINSSASGALAKSDVLDATTIRIGHSHDGISFPFYGNISNFRIYDKALSSAEVALA